MVDDLISRQAAIAYAISGRTRESEGEKWIRVSEVRESLQTMPPEPVLDILHGEIFGYSIEHLLMIADFLRKGGLPPEKISDALTDIDRAAYTVKEEFATTIRNAYDLRKEK